MRPAREAPESMAEVIVALDLPSGAEALALVDRLPGLRWVKVGSILMTREGPALVRELVARGLEVFLDLKWHDIPNTVAGAVEQARAQGVRMATVHCLGGPVMLEAAARAAGDELGLVGVTVLTSHDPASYGAAVGRSEVDLLAEVERQAGRAVACGLRGVVCSPRETAAVRGRIGPGRWIVVPGIRRPGDAAGDQVRTAGPAEAAAAGATHLVVGRPVLAAADPAAAFRALQEAAG
ncbi:MAG TPA: orotidine-5'-phosphate decarboxylase [Gemmatimonadales bacterium]|nr:orotidine-5'-phosphate decarboxylase [Gemmatimonadales bacterium]